jgi:Na+-translocating ferredoxin:NAD+ oxidoreductase RnfD subunit
VKWYNYLSCFLAGVFLIHILPHLLNGMSVKNVLGVLVSLVGGCLLLWVGKFSLRNPLAVVLVLLGMASVWVFVTLHPHHHPASKTVSSATTAGSSFELAEKSALQRKMYPSG